jgi:Arc/MetJ-type ribon-helix-helix transcriptional regulator
MDRMWQARLRAELQSMCDSRCRTRYQGRAEVIRRAVRRFEFRDLSDAAIDAAAREAGLLP